MKEYIVKVYEDRTEWFNKEGDLHREGAPAIEWHNSSFKSWWLNGKLHREDGAAIEWHNGNKEWYLNGKRHREDGAAIEFSNGYKSWYLYGEKLTEEEFNQRTKPSCDGREVEIDGRKYILTEVR